MKNKSNGERTYSMLERVSLTDLASWQEEGGDRQGVIWVTVDSGKRKINNGVKVYSGLHLIQPNLIARTCLTDGSNMSDGLRPDNLS
jgi:hypothetical protein